MKNRQRFSGSTVMARPRGSWVYRPGCRHSTPERARPSDNTYDCGDTACTPPKWHWRSRRTCAHRYRSTSSKKEEHPWARPSNCSCPRFARLRVGRCRPPEEIQARREALAARNKGVADLRRRLGAVKQASPRSATREKGRRPFLWMAPHPACCGVARSALNSPTNPGSGSGRLRHRASAPARGPWTPAWR